MKSFQLDIGYQTVYEFSEYGYDISFGDHDKFDMH